MSRLIRNTSFYTIGNILPKAAGFFLLPLYTKFLTPEDYGIISSMNILMTILMVFFTMSIERSIYRLYFDHKTETDKKDYLGTIFITLTLNACIVLVAVLLGRNLISKVFTSIPFYPFYSFAIASVFFSVFGVIPSIYFQVEQKAGKFVLLGLAQFFIGTILKVYFVVFTGKGADGVLLAGLLKTIIFLPFFVFIIVKIINFKFNKDIMKESMIYSIPLMPMILSAWILNLSDRIFIERYFTLKDVGLYSLSYKLAELLLILSTAFNKAYDPLFYKIANQIDQVEARQKLTKYNKVYSIVLIYCSLAISLFAREFIQLLDAKFRSAYQMVPIIIIGVLFGQISGLFNKSMYQEKKTKPIMFLTFYAAMLNIVLNFLFVPNYGAYGAAYATTITFIFFFVIKYFYSKKCYFIPLAWKELFYYLGLAVIIVSAFYFTNFNLWLSLLLKTLIMFGFTFLLLYRYKTTILKLIPIKRRIKQ